MDLKIKHIARADLPWRKAKLTECGKPIEKHPTYTRSKFFDLIKRYGRQRTQMMSCVTCYNTANNHRRNDDNPIKVLARAIEWEVGGSYYHTRTDRGTLLQDELASIVMLIEKYSEEFQSNIDIVKAKRDWNEMKNKRGRAQ